MHIHIPAHSHERARFKRGRDNVSYACVHVCMYAYMYMHLYMHPCMYICIHVCIHAYTRVRVCAYIHLHTYTYIQTGTCLIVKRTK